MSALLAAPPIPNETAFFLRFVQDVSGIRDEHGRPLHEVDFRDELDGDDVRPCPYAGSRHGYLMNHSALQVIAKDWRRVRAGLRLLVDLVDPAAICPDAATRVWARALLPMFVPLYLLRRAQLRDDAVVLPNDVAGLFKVMLDVPTTIDLMLIADWAEDRRPAPARYGADSIAAYAERSGILNNGDWTCAAPPGLLRELLELLDPLAAAGSEEPSSLSSLAGAGDFPPFALVHIRQYALSQAFQITTSCLMERAFAAEPCRRTSEDDARLPAYEMRRRIALRACGSEARAARVVRRFCAIAAAGASAAAAESAAGAAMLDALETPGCRSAAAVCELQDRVEDAFRAGTDALHQQAGRALGPDGPRPPVDLRCLESEDFPSVILRRRVTRHRRDTR